MPIDLIREENGGVIFKGVGVVEGKEALSLNQGLYSSDEAISEIRYQLIDLTEVTEFNFSSSDMRKLAGSDRKAFMINPAMKVAIVAPDAFSFGMNRVYDSYVSDHLERVMLFKDLQSAREWLDEGEESPAS